MTARIIVQLAGPFEVEIDSGPTLDLPSRCQAILAFLALSEGSASRSALATLIWGDRGEEQARASLRQALSVLRRTFPEGVIDADRSTVRLNLSRVDLAEGQPGAELLAGIELPSEPFEDWLRQARAAHRASAIEAVLTTAQEALQSSNPKRAVGAAREALRIDPLSEAALRLLMRAEFAVGNRAAALQAYEQVRARLLDELGSEPSAETQGLCEELRSDRPAAKAEISGRPDRPTVAVMAFDDLTPGEADMFADGVVDEITSALSRVREFDVIARQSAFALRGAGLDVPTTAERLGANYLVEGSVRRAGDRVRIAVQLVRGRDGHTVWSQRFDDRLDDLFDLQDRIAAHVAGQLAPTLRAAEIARANRLPPESQSAYSLTLQALPHFWAHRREENLRAIELLDHALAQSPDYAPALAYKAWCHAHHCCYLWSANAHTDRQTALDLSAKAMPLVQEDASALVALSATMSLAGNDFQQAGTLVDRALALDPNNAWGWLRKGWNTLYLSDAEGALEAFDRSERLSPLDPFHFNVLFGRSAALRSFNRYDEAIELVEQGLRAGPGVTWAYRMLAGTLWLAGRHDEAREAAQKWRDSNPMLTPELLQVLLPKWTHDPEWRETLQLLWSQTD